LKLEASLNFGNNIRCIAVIFCVKCENRAIFLVERRPIGSVGYHNGLHESPRRDRIANVTLKFTQAHRLIFVPIDSSSMTSY